MVSVNLRGMRVLLHTLSGIDNANRLIMKISASFFHVSLAVPMDDILETYRKDIQNSSH